MRHYLVFMVAYFITASCKNFEVAYPEEKLVTEFPETITLQSDSVKFKGLKFPVDLHILDSIILISDSKEPFFHLFNIDSFQPIGAFGRKGRGSNKFSLPAYTNQNFSHGDNKSIWIFDIHAKRLALYNLDRLLANDTTVPPNREYFLPPSTLPVIKTVILNNDIISGFSLSNRGRLFFSKVANNENVVWIPYFPKLREKHNSLMDWSQIYMSNIAANPEATRVVSAPIKFPRIDVFTASTELEYSIALRSNFGEPHPAGVAGEGSDLYYVVDIKSNKFGFCVLYKGNSPQTEILCFDWTGRPGSKFILDQDIDRFVIEKDRTIYGLQINQGSFGFYKFDLPI